MEPDCSDVFGQPFMQCNAHICRSGLAPQVWIPYGASFVLPVGRPCGAVYTKIDGWLPVWDICGGHLAQLQSPQKYKARGFPAENFMTSTLS